MTYVVYIQLSVSLNCKQIPDLIEIYEPVSNWLSVANIHMLLHDTAAFVCHIYMWVVCALFKIISWNRSLHVTTG